MATFTGHAGVINFDGDAIGNLRSFTIEQSQDSIETTSMNTAGDSSVAKSRTYVPGLSTFTISGDVYFDGMTADAQANLEASVTKSSSANLATFKVYPVDLTSNTVIAFEGSAVVTSISISSSVDGIVEASFSAQGSGDLTSDIAANIA